MARGNQQVCGAILADPVIKAPGVSGSGGKADKTSRGARRRILTLNGHHVLPAPAKLPLLDSLRRRTGILQIGRLEGDAAPAGQAIQVDTAVRRRSREVGLSEPGC